VKNSFDVKENDNHATDFPLQLSRLFPVSVSFDFPSTAHAFFPERLCNRWQDIRCNLSAIYTESDAHSLFLLRILREIASDLIHDSK
jgi:hypothetical protein